jgi:acyl-CoA synthetase (AMP-forming)/AMP-acid ligase II/NAD(P)-dependent dehydrogenase (short-subunit alcohol dehydrogenase family)/acyl carrier protein
MPLTAEGLPDDEALRRLPVIDAALLDRCEQQVNAQIAPRRARAVMQDHVTHSRALHLSKLLPLWKAESAAEPETGAADASGIPLAAPGRMAFSDGGPLHIPAGAPQTVTEAFLRTAREHPAKGVTFVLSRGNELFATYAELLARARRILTGLRAQGMKPGDAAILQISHLPDHFAAFWACILGGIHPAIVAVAPSFEKSNPVMMKLFNTWELLGHPPVLTGAAMRSALSDYNTLAVESLEAHEETADIHLPNHTDVVFYQLTSGSTGAPKCIQETHRGILHHVHGSAEFVGYRQDDVILNWLPLDHVVPTLTVHLKDACMGCSEVQVKTEAIVADPVYWLELMDRHRVTHTWAPNFGFRIVSEALTARDSKHFDLSCVKRFMNAGEQVTLPVVEEFLGFVRKFGVPEQAMQPAFGMAEACTCMTYRNDFSVESDTHWILKSSAAGTLMKGEPRGRNSMSFIDLGPPMPGVQIRIADRENQLLPEGVIGRFQIKGAVITPGYLHNEKANRESFVGDGWFDSGDLGFILNGSLTLTGRAKEMIIIRGANFYCYEIEDVVNRVESVEPTWSAACAVDDASGSEGLAVFFVPRSQNGASKSAIARAIRTRVAADIGVTPSFLVPLTREEFPKTTSGKIQRGQMKRLLMEGHYAERLAELDIELENANTLPDWFFQTVWRRKEIASIPSGRGAVLLLTDGAPLAGALQSALESQGRTVIAAQGGDEIPDGFHPETIVHMRSCPDAPESGFEIRERVLDNAVYGLADLVRNLASGRRGNALRKLIVVSTHAQATRPEDVIVAEKAMAAGLVRTIAQELPSLLCRHVDLGSGSAESARVLMNEIDSDDSEAEVAYRDGRRFAPRLERSRVDPATLQPVPFKAGGLYLITGGAGGIGIEIAAWLVKTFNARVLAIGRSPLNAGRIPHFLKSRPESFRYEQADVASAASLSHACGAERFDGVLHLAAEYRERPLAEETRESLASAIRAKVHGAAALHSLLPEGGIFIHFSSVTHLFGGAAIGAYAAANRFLDAFAHRQRTEAGIRSYCLDWSTWDELGVSKDHPAIETLRTRGYEAISIRRGLQSLLAAVCRPPGNLIIGLDDRKAFLRQFSESQPAPFLRPVALVEPGAPLPAGIEIQDAFGTPVFCEIQAFNAAAGIASALTAMQRKIVALWKDVLGIETLHIDDNFFDLGGNSLLLVTMAARVQQEFGKPVGTVELFRHPTVAKLARYLETSDDQPVKDAFETARARAASRVSRIRTRRDGRPTEPELVCTTDSHEQRD